MIRKYRATERPESPQRSVKADDDSSSRTMRGYASAWGFVDSYDEIILKGAFADTLADEGHAARRKILWNHRGGAWYSDRPIGVPSVLEEDDYGLYYETEVAPTPLGDEVLALYRADVITENSIGFSMKWDDVEMMIGPDGDQVMAIKRVEQLWEVSPVLWGANSGAIMLSAGGRPAWLAMRDELDKKIHSVKSLLGSKSIISRMLANERRRFDSCGSEPGCQACGGCGKRQNKEEQIEHAADISSTISEATKVLSQIKRARSKSLGRGEYLLGLFE